jgi:hypothetical protein
MLQDNTLELLEEEFGSPILDEQGRAICGARKLRDGNCNRLAGWGTVHSGVGPCKEHGGRIETAIVQTSTQQDYRLYLKHVRLRELYEEQTSEENIDALDNEIMLLRAMLRLMSEQFGVDILSESEEDPGADELIVQFNATSSQVNAIGKNVKILGDLIEQKYRLMHIAGQAMPREAVEAYVNQIRTILAGVLKNQCLNCGTEHGDANRVFTALRQLGGI